jgi:hypothetical protein
MDGDFMALKCKEEQEHRPTRKKDHGEILGGPSWCVFQAGVNGKATV